MSEKRISNDKRTFDDYKKSIIDITKKYYPEIYKDFNDASIGSWFVDLYADIADNISYNIQNVENSLFYDTLQDYSSIYNLAKNNGVKIPGVKPSVVEVELSCEIPLNKQGNESDRNLSIADESFCPIVKRGTILSTGVYSFELNEDVDFTKQFNNDGFSDRKIIPKRDSNGIIISYIYQKRGIAVAGKTKIFKKVLNRGDVEPFMTIDLPDSDVINVESIIVKEGNVNNGDPLIEEFYSTDDKRYYEVDNLSEQLIFKDKPLWVENEEVLEIKNEDGTKTYYPFTNRSVLRGAWVNEKKKFVTDFNEDGTMTITFGSGLYNQTTQEMPNEVSEFNKYLMSRMFTNDYMGVLPNENSTIYVLYRVGGGDITNIGQGTLTNIVYLKMEVGGNCDDSLNERKKANVKSSLKVTNPYPSYGGRNRLNVEELKQYIKYYRQAQNRCVTLKDYEYKLMEMPLRYGTPFRCSVVEENNKIVLYTLGLDNEGYLSSPIPLVVVENIKNYLSKYKMVNDFIEVKSGKIINIGLKVDVFIDKKNEQSKVTKNIYDVIKNYMDVRKHFMGEDIYLGDLEKEISNIEGVLNLIRLEVYNLMGEGYSENSINQKLVDNDTCYYIGFEEEDKEGLGQVDLYASDKVLYSDKESMFEIKYPSKDIKINIKVR